MNIKKIIKIFILIALANFLATNFCCAQEVIMPEQAQNIKKQEQLELPEYENKMIENETMPNNSVISPTETTSEILKKNEELAGKNFPALNEILKKYEPPKEVPKDKRPEKPKNANPNKPDICGSIIFDLTEKEQPISLKEALEISMEKNFDIKIFAQRTERDKWKYYQTITNWLPDVAYTQLVQRNQGQFVIAGILSDVVKETAIQSNIDYNFTASIRKYFDIKIAKNEYNSQKKELEFTKNQIIRDSAIKYYELLRSKRGIEILETNIKQIKEQLRINKEKLEAGIGTKFDVLRAEADLARASQELTLAKNIYRLNQAQLANLMGVSVFIQLVPDDDDIKIKEIFKDCFDLDKAKELAFVNRPDLKAAQFDIEAAKQRKNSGYSIYVPEISLIGQIARQGTIETVISPNQFTGLLAQWNAGASLGLKGYTDIKYRTAELEEAKLNYINKSRDIEENLVRTFFNTVTARSLVDSTWTEVQTAAESRNISVVRLKAGIGTFIDVLQTQTTYTTAKINHLRAVVGYDISQIELLFEMGVISVNNILDGFNSNNCKTAK